MGLLTDINEVASHTTERKNPAAAGQGETKFYSPPGATDNPQASPPGGQQPTTGKISKEEAERTGKTNAYLFASSFELARTTILAIKENRILTPEEKEIFASASIKDPNVLTEIETKVLQKYARASARLDKKKEKVPTKDEDMKMLIEGFATYSEVTGKKSSPEMILLAMGFRFCSSVAMDTFLD